MVGMSFTLEENSQERLGSGDTNNIDVRLEVTEFEGVPNFLLSIICMIDSSIGFFLGNL